MKLKIHCDTDICAKVTWCLGSLTLLFVLCFTLHFCIIPVLNWCVRIHALTLSPCYSQELQHKCFCFPHFIISICIFSVKWNYCSGYDSYYSARYKRWQVTLFCFKKVVLLRWLLCLFLPNMQQVGVQTDSGEFIVCNGMPVCNNFQWIILSWWYVKKLFPWRRNNWWLWLWQQKTRAWKVCDISAHDMRKTLSSSKQTAQQVFTCVLETLCKDNHWWRCSLFPNWRPQVSFSFPNVSVHKMKKGKYSALRLVIKW